MRSDTAFFSAAVIGRRFLSGLASDLLCAAAAAAGFLVEEDRREVVERDDGGADAPRISSTSVNALVSAWRRSISLCRSAMACAMTLMKLESSGPVREMSTSADAADGRRQGPPSSARLAGMLDTLAVAQELTASGIDRNQAEVIAGAIGHAAEQSEHVTSDQFKAGLSEVRAEIAEVRTEIASLDTRLSTQIAGVRTEVANLETRLIRWMVGTVIATATLTVGILRLTGG